MKVDHKFDMNVLRLRGGAPPVHVTIRNVKEMTQQLNQIEARMAVVDLELVQYVDEVMRHQRVVVQAEELIADKHQMASVPCLLADQLRGQVDRLRRLPIIHTMQQQRLEQERLAEEHRLETQRLAKNSDDSFARFSDFANRSMSLRTKEKKKRKWSSESADLAAPEAHETSQ